MKKILVLDDSHVIRRLVEVVLGQMQLDIATVSNGAEACRTLVCQAPDLLILDVGLPDMSGWDVLEFVRGRPDLNGTAVIMLTGRTDADDINRAADMGADEYLQKPFRPDELRQLVMDTIQRSANAKAL